MDHQANRGFTEAMSDSPDSFQYPRSAYDELDGIIYLPRMLDKMRLMHAGTLHPDLHANLGLAMDLWTCQFLGVDYHELKTQVLAGASDEDALVWARKHGVTRADFELTWFTSHIKKFGFKDQMSGRLQERLRESGFEDRSDIQTFMDYIEVDEGRDLPN